MEPFAPIFLVGCPRSGTTLLRRMLSAHPDVAIAPETFFVRKFWGQRRRYGDLACDAHLDRLLTDLLSFRGVADASVDAGALRRAARRTDRRYPTLFALFLRHVAWRQGARVTGEKTPEHVFHIERLRTWFPHARFVHLVRDARAVVNSWRGVPWSSGALWRDATAWRTHVGAARRERPGRSLCHLRYEALVHRPERELRALCRFLALPFDTAMLRFHEQPARRSRGQSGAAALNVEREPWKKNATRPLDPAAASRWRRELAPSMVRQVEGRAAREMRRWGYAPRTPPGRLRRARIETQLRQWAWQAGTAAEAARRLLAR